MIGTELRDAGLHARALAAWVGTERIAALPTMMPRVAAREVTPAATLLALFVAGVDVAVERLRALAEPLRAGGFIEIAGATAHACVSILPVGQALVVCDRLDRAAVADLVCWPDDSSYHLARAIPPGRRARWLDLGTGSAFAPLVRPELASAIVGSELNPRAARFARLGAALSGVAHLAICEGDLAGPPGPYELVTCNAPIPDGPDRDAPAWRSTDAGFISRMFDAAAAHVAPDGLIVVHAALDALEVLADRPGDRVVVAYTPTDVRGFAVAWWQPDGKSRHVVAHRPLTPSRPHLDHEDRTVAVADR